MHASAMGHHIAKCPMGPSAYSHAALSPVEIGTGAAVKHQLRLLLCDLGVIGG